MDNKQFLISVIIPVYNMEKYLARCVDSVIAAQVDGMQIVLVDDGSKDSSPALCDAYADSYCNIQVIHQQNGGLSAARNTGMRCAQGEYLFFLDSDDAVDPQIFAKFVAHLEKSESAPDVVLCDAMFVHVVTQKQTPMVAGVNEKEMNGIKGEEAIRQILIANPDFEWHCWRYFYRRAFVEKEQMLFPVGRCYEDVLWTPRAILKAERVSYLPAISILYTYGRADSIVNSVSLKKVQDKLSICNDACQNALNVQDSALRNMLLKSLGELYISAFRNYCYGLKEAYPYLKEYRHLLQYSKSRFGKLLRKLTGCFGFCLGTELTKIAFKIVDARR